MKRSKVFLVGALLLALAAVGANLHYHFLAVSGRKAPLEKGPSVGRVIRVVNYNSQGQSERMRSPEGARQYLALIDSLNPDVLVVEEMNYFYSKELREALNARFPFQTANSYPDYNGYEVLFSKFPIRSFVRYQLTDRQLQAIGQRFQLDLTIPAEAYLHYNKPALMGQREWEFWHELRTLYNVVLEVDHRPMLLVCCHLMSNNTAPLFEGFERGRMVRQIQASAIRDSVAAYGLPTVVCGDLNDWEGSPVLETLMAAPDRGASAKPLRSAWWEAGCGLGFTFGKGWLHARIDHVLVSADWRVLEARVAEVDLSDHRPLVVDVQWVGSAEDAVAP